MAPARFFGLALVLALASCDDRRPSAPPPAYGGGGPVPGGGPAGTTTPTGASGGAGSPGCGKAAKTQVGIRVTAMNRARTYTLVVPESYDPKTPYPLVFVLHGNGGSSAHARTQTDLEKQASGKAIFAYPDALRGAWDLDSEASVNPDVAFFDLMLLQAHNATCLDARRVFVTGFSNGAYMANQLGCKRGERIRGVVTHSGGGPYDTHGGYDATGHLVCPQKPVASLVIHGQSDGTVAPSEGQKSIDHWTYANHCGRGTSGAFVPPCTTYDGCANPVGACLVPGLGHATWKEAGRVTWQFVESQH